MRALVTGASGYLGMTLLERVPDGIEAIGASYRRSSDHHCDITDPAAVDALMTAVKPDVVIHCAAISLVGQCTRNPEQAFAVNADGAGYVAQAAAHIDARLIAISTDYVFDGEAGNYSEVDEPNPINAYGRSKVAGEQAVTSVHPEALIVRTTMMAGRDRADRFPFSSYVIDRAERGETLDLYIEEIRSFVPVTTMADATWELTGSETTGILHVAATQGASRVEFAEALLDRMGIQAAIVESASPPGRAHDLSLDVTKAQSELKTPLPDLDATITEVIADRASETRS